jgi:hypothetical protein
MAIMGFKFPKDTQKAAPIYLLVPLFAILPILKPHLAVSISNQGLKVVLKSEY